MNTALPVHVSDLKDACKKQHPQIASIKGPEFDHAVHAALETLKRNGLAVHCHKSGVPAIDGERTYYWRSK